jgi:hypothetical protein
MFTFAPKPKSTQQTSPANSAIAEPDCVGQSRAVRSILHLQRTIGNHAVQRLLDGNTKDPKGDSTTTETAHIQRKDPPKDAPAAPAPPAPAPPAPAPKKTAGVDSFTVVWTENAASGPTIAQLRLDTTAKFKKDASHDPALAEFRQNAAQSVEITAGPHKGQKHSEPMQDDHYSRTDDTKDHKLSDVDFVTNDNPGNKEDTPLDKDDGIDFSFTAEQMIIDTGDGNKVIAKRGPYTGTIKGKHPRQFGGVPKTLS